MIKTLTKHGNRLALVIEKSILDQIGADTRFEISTDGQALILTPVKDADAGNGHLGKKYSHRG